MFLTSLPRCQTHPVADLASRITSRQHGHHNTVSQEIQGAIAMQTVRRVRHDVADGLTLMVFSLVSSVVLAAALALLVGAL